MEVRINLISLHALTINGKDSAEKNSDQGCWPVNETKKDKTKK